jgi:hypothetical protein
MKRSERLLQCTLIAGVVLATPWFVTAAVAASSNGCEGGGYTVSVPGQSISTDGESTIPASQLGFDVQISVKGKYNEFTIVAPSFQIENWAFTGAPNPLDITGGRRTLVWDKRIPDHRGLTLTRDALVDRREEDLVIQRSGNGLTMKIQAKDCAQGGIFQAEVERADGTRTRFTHILNAGVFYFDNPNFRKREGDVLPYKTTTVTVTPRINIANDLSPKFVGRDSPQVATRVSEATCPNQIQKRDGTFVAVLHCGRVSRWDVASGGRMGWVTGEDSTEVAPPATNCTQDCQAQNRVRGQAVVLGFPFPVPATSRLKPDFPGNAATATTAVR